jgi:hypothetical protein
MKSKIEKRMACAVTNRFFLEEKSFEQVHPQRFQALRLG